MKEGRECPVSPNPFGRGPGHPAGITVSGGQTRTGLVLHRRCRPVFDTFFSLGPHSTPVRLGP